MELDEMRSLWQSVDGRLQAMEAAGRRDKAGSKLGFVRFVLWYEIAFGVVAVLLAGSYLADHVTQLRFALPAALLHLAALATLGIAVWQQVQLSPTGYSEPVVEMQRRLAALRLWRARANRWLLLSSPLLWALLVIVVPHALIGLDVYDAFGLPWVLGNLGFGFAVLAVAAWVSRRFPDRIPIGDDLTGRKVAAASAFLAEVKAFGTEG